PCVGRTDDDRPAHTAAKVHIWSDRWLLRSHRLGLRSGSGHATNRRGCACRAVRLGWRTGHLLALGPGERYGPHPAHAAGLDFAASSQRLPRFLDFGLPGDRRLKIRLRKIVGVMRLRPSLIGTKPKQTKPPELLNVKLRRRLRCHS